MIGLAAAVYLLVNGRVMGASGIIGGLVDGSGRDGAGERLSFLAALVGVPLVVAHLFGLVPATAATGNLAALITAGLLVGLGTRLANGCTSGHGICGLGSLQWPSLAAVLTFMATAFATAQAVALWTGVAR